MQRKLEISIKTDRLGTNQEIKDHLQKNKQCKESSKVAISIRIVKTTTCSLDMPRNPYLGDFIIEVDEEKRSWESLKTRKLNY